MNSLLGGFAFIVVMSFFIVLNTQADASSYQANTLQRDSYTVYYLEDTKTQARAEFVPALGGNLVQLRLTAQEQTYELIPEVDLQLLSQHATLQGMPILFPFPGVTPQGEYMFNGKKGKLAPSPNITHNYHGFACTSPWQVISHSAEEKQAKLVIQLTPDCVKQAEQQYPFAFSLTIEYCLTASRLTINFKLENTGSDPLPFALGIHPYFHWPFIPDTNPADYRLQLAADNYAVDTDNWRTVKSLPVTPEVDSRAGLKPVRGFGQHYINLQTTAGWSETIFHIPGQSPRLTVRARDDFGAVVLYMPPNPGGVASIEPYSALPNAINRPVDPDWQARIRVLESGAIHNTSIVLALE